MGLGSVFMIIALFLPWYKDLDSFKTGDMFLGITGPLSLAGFTLFAIATVNIALMVYDFLDKKPPLSIKSNNFYLFAGIFSFYLLIVINSVYFNAQFGVNITLKQSMFGMFVAFIAASFITIGGYLAGKDKKIYLEEFEKNTRDPFAEMPVSDSRKPKGSIKVGSQKQNLPNPETVLENRAFVQGSFDSVNNNKTKEDAGFPPQPFRTDL